MKTSVRVSLPLLLAAALLVAPTPSARAGSEEGQAVAMVTDVAITRPAGLGILLLGSVAFVVSLPITACNGHAAEARKVLVETPYKITFKRKLGATDVE